MYNKSGGDPSEVQRTILLKIHSQRTATSTLYTITGVACYNLTHTNNNCTVSFPVLQLIVYTMYCIHKQHCTFFTHNFMFLLKVK